MTAELLRILLVLYALAALGIGFSYLARKRLSIGEWLLWGTIAITVPVFGPFFVIAARPGPRNRSRRPRPARGRFA
jgi:hypothetical protein